jgi:hypothetical protein
VPRLSPSAKCLRRERIRRRRRRSTGPTRTCSGAFAQAGTSYWTNSRTAYDQGPHHRRHRRFEPRLQCVGRPSRSLGRECSVAKYPPGLGQRLASFRGLVRWAAIPLAPGRARDGRALSRRARNPSIRREADPAALGHRGRPPHGRIHSGHPPSGYRQRHAGPAQPARQRPAPHPIACSLHGSARFSVNHSSSYAANYRLRHCFRCVSRDTETIDMCLIALPMLLISASTAYVSTKQARHSSWLEILTGLSLIVGLATLGWCLPLYR